MNDHVSQLIKMAITEDVHTGDVTSEYFIEEDRTATAYVLVKADGVVAGHTVAQEVCRQIDTDIDYTIIIEDGEYVTNRTRVAKISGNARSVLTAERTLLNFMQRLSGVASKAYSFVQEVKHTDVVILDTRKTTPGWRLLEKNAVKLGGASNHRMGLYDRAMVKDNHIVTQHDLASMQKGIHRLKTEKPNVEVELEVDTLEQLKNFLTLDGVDYILLDNMGCDQLREAVQIRGSHPVQLEASGGVNMNTVKAIAETGVDFISIGALTHSAVALDISLEFIIE